MSFAWNSFRVRLTLVFGGLTLASLLSAGYYIGRVASAELSEATGESLHAMATTGAGLLSANLRERQTEVSLLSQSALLTHGRLDSSEVRATIQRLQLARSEYAWIGLTDDSGRVLQASSGILEGERVDQRPWFRAAVQGPFTGDVHEAVLLAKKLAPRPGNEPLRFVDFASPILNGQGQLRGVLGVHAHWHWVTDTLRSVVTPQAVESGVETLIVNRRGEVLYPFSLIGQTRLPAGLGKQHFAALPWDDGLTYLVPLPITGNFDPGWQIVMRQPIDLALQPVHALQRQLIGFGLGTALLFALLAYRLSRSISRPLEQLAQTAERIERRERPLQYPDIQGSAEFEQLSRSLQGMTQALLAREDELERLNAGLEQQVAERTAALRAANAQLEILARKDALTGLNNRRTFDERMQEFFQRLKRSQRPFAVILMDIDHFKQINDGHGHNAGDEVLRQFAATLQGCVRATDVVARIGGEEFAALLPEARSEAEALAVAEKIRLAVMNAEFPPVGRLTLSLGVTLAADTDAGESGILRRADSALYQAKHQGRNRTASLLAD